VCPADAFPFLLQALHSGRRLRSARCGQTLEMPAELLERWNRSMLLQGCVGPADFPPGKHELPSGKSTSPPSPSKNVGSGCLFVRRVSLIPARISSSRARGIAPARRISRSNSSSTCPCQVSLAHRPRWLPAITPARPLSAPKYTESGWGMSIAISGIPACLNCGDVAGDRLVGLKLNR
jgi:hypothetical protein